MKLNEVETLARELMDKHGFESVPFKFDGGLRRFGRYREYRGRPELISLSRHWATRRPESDVRNTILHEIAHAIAGAAAGHGPKWKAAALAVGARPERCSSIPLEETNKLAKYHVYCDCSVHKGKVVMPLFRLSKTWQRGGWVCKFSKNKFRVVEVR